MSASPTAKQRLDQSRHGSSRHRRSDPLHQLPPAAPARADFFLLYGRRHVLLVPATTRAAWFLSASPLADPPALIPRIGSARLLRGDLAAALLPLLAENFRLRYCPRLQPNKTSTP